MAIVTNLNAQYALTGDFVSDIWNVESLKSSSIQFNWTGADAVDSTLVPQVSNDGVNFSDADTPPPTLTLDAASGTKMWVFREELAVRYIRLSYTAASNTTGTGTVFSFGHDKNLGWK